MGALGISEMGRSGASLHLIGSVSNQTAPTVTAGYAKIFANRSRQEPMEAMQMEIPRSKNDVGTKKTTAA